MLWLNNVKELKSTINDYSAHKKLIEKYKETEKTLSQLFQEKEVLMIFLTLMKLSPEEF